VSKGAKWAIGIGILLVVGQASQGGLKDSTTPSMPPEPDLAGRVQFAGNQFAIYGNDARPWRECRFTVNDKYRYEFAGIDSGAVERVDAGSVVASAGERFNPIRYAPTAFTLRCRVNGTNQFLNGRW
jgi:hypothetical protein